MLLPSASFHSAQIQNEIQKFGIESFLALEHFQSVQSTEHKLSQQTLQQPYLAAQCYLLPIADGELRLRDGGLLKNIHIKTPISSETCSHVWQPSKL